MRAARTPLSAHARCVRPAFLQRRACRRTPRTARGPGSLPFAFDEVGVEPAAVEVDRVLVRGRAPGSRVDSGLRNSRSWLMTTIADRLSATKRSSCSRPWQVEVVGRLVQQQHVEPAQQQRREPGAAACPPDSAVIGVSSQTSSPTSAATAAARSARSAAPSASQRSSASEYSSPASSPPSASASVVAVERVLRVGHTGAPRQVGEHGLARRAVRSPGGGARCSRRAVPAATVPGRRRVEAREQTQQRGLAGTVRADQADDVARARRRGRGRRTAHVRRGPVREPTRAHASCAVTLGASPRSSDPSDRNELRFPIDRAVKSLSISGPMTRRPRLLTPMPASRRRGRPRTASARSTTSPTRASPASSTWPTGSASRSWSRARPAPARPSWPSRSPRSSAPG